MKEDPYEALACKIFARYTDKDLKRLFEDPTYLRQIVLDELWDTDFTGIFLDVIFEKLGKKREKDRVGPAMEELAKVLADTIDLSHLMDKLLELA